MAEGSLSALAYKGSLAAFEEAAAGRAGGVELFTLPDEDARTPLHWAAAGGNASVLALLLHRLHHADAASASPPAARKCVNAKDESGLTPLMSAAAGGHTACVRALLDAGADAHARDDKGCTALHFHKGRAQVLETLLPVSTPVMDGGDEGGVTPLHRAAGPGYYDAVRLLLAAGARVDVRDGQGDTPLHYACEEGRAEVVALLLENGARADVVNAAGRVPVDLVPRGNTYDRTRNTVRAATG